jgi:hypothetical protein
VSVRSWAIPLGASALPLSSVYGGGSPYAQLVLADGASNYWRLDELSGTVAADQIGANPGTIIGAVLLGQPGPVVTGRAFTFNGSNTSYVALGNFAFPAASSYEAWIRTTNGITQSPIVTSYNGAIWGPYFGKGQTHLFDYMPWGAGQEAFFSIGAINTGAWFHVVLTHDGTTSRFYINGVLDNTKLQTSQAAVAGAAWFIAHSTGLPTEGWPGSIAEVAVYPVVLTPLQVAAHAAAASVPAVSPAAADIPYRQLTLRALAATAYLGASSAVSPAAGLPLLPGQTTRLGPFDNGPLKLSQLYAVGAGATLQVAGVPY